jgi:hypothetical protein
LARGIACVLLIGLIYTASFGAAHSHIDGPSGLDKDIAYGAAGKTVLSTDLPRHGQSDGHNCPICLLRQHLLDCIAGASVSYVSPSELIDSNSELAIPFLTTPIASRPITRLSGRAPPRD